MARQRQGNAEKRAYGLRAGRKAWARAVRRRLDREAATDDAASEELEEFGLDAPALASVVQARRGERG